MSARGQRFDSFPASWRSEVAYGRGARHYELIGAAGLFGTGFGADALSEIRDVERDAQALDDQLLAQLPVPTKVAIASGTATPAMLAEPRAAFYVNSWAPWLGKWHAYKSEHESTWNKLVDLAKGPLLHRDDYFDVQHWRDELAGQWTAAQHAGFHLIGAPPKAGDKSLGQRAAEQGAGLLDEAKTVGRVILWGGVALLGAFGVATVVNAARSGSSSRGRR